VILGLDGSRNHNNRSKIADSRVHTQLPSATGVIGNYYTCFEMNSIKNCSRLRKIENQNLSKWFQNISINVTIAKILHFQQNFYGIVHASRQPLDKAKVEGVMGC
jgi:hypothetical protein